MFKLICCLAVAEVADLERFHMGCATEPNGLGYPDLNVIDGGKAADSISSGSRFMRDRKGFRRKMSEIFK